MSNFDPLDMQANEKADVDRKEKQRITTRQATDDFKWLMADPRGRRIVWGLLELTGMYRSSFTGNSETFFREGQRNIGLQIMAMIHSHTADKYAIMVKEQNDDHK